MSGATIFGASPGFLAALLDAEVPVETFASVRLVTSAGEALPADLHRRFTQRYGIPLLDGIGTTEALHIFLSNHAGAERPGTSGTAVEGYELELRDEQDHLVEGTGPGFLHVKGPSIATGYWSRTAETQAAFRGEWLRTGDVYERSEDGHWAFLGRNSDMIKAGGIWVSPAEVEAVLVEHPDVLEAAVVGARDERGLELVVAFVVPRAGRSVDDASIEAHCRERMASFKRPRRVRRGRRAAQDRHREDPALRVRAMLWPRAPSEPERERSVSVISEQAVSVLEMYRTMHLIRAFELKAYEAHEAGLIRGGIHSYVGEEAIATGVCAHLGNDDYVNSYHRGHGHSIAKGTDPVKMMKELLGRVGGTSDGRGGSMHIADLSVGMVGANGLVGDGVTLAVGVAHSIRVLGQNRVSVVFFGDGAVNRGPLLESLNWAQVFSLPVLFVCEDNRFAASTPQETVTSGGGFTPRAEGFGLRGESIDGNDVNAVFETAGRLLDGVRGGEGPAFIHAKTFRHYSHNIRSAYTTDLDERPAWLPKDPVPRCAQWLRDAGVAEADLEAAAADAEATMIRALDEAKAAPFPDPAIALTEVQDLGAPR